MLKPTAAAIATYLSEVNANAASLQPLVRAADGTPAKPNAAPAPAEPLVCTPQASTSNVPDAYNALRPTSCWATGAESRPATSATSSRVSGASGSRPTAARCHVNN